VAAARPLPEQVRRRAPAPRRRRARRRRHGRRSGSFARRTATT